MTESDSGADARLSVFSGDQELIAEIPAGIGDLLHDRAKERYLRRVWQALFFIALVAFVGAIAPPPDLTPGERVVGVMAVLGLLGYLAYGFTLLWPERWEHQLLLDEIEHKRRTGKWRWER